MEKVNQLSGKEEIPGMIELIIQTMLFFLSYERNDEYRDLYVDGDRRE
jgi:hypothetical protein